MDASELRARARQEADELGPEPPGSEAELWREERWGAVVLLAGLADDNAELLRHAANATASEWTDREAARLLLDAATLAEIGGCFSATSRTSASELLNGIDAAAGPTARGIH
jgi:hypothetical protein